MLRCTCCLGLPWGDNSAGEAPDAVQKCPAHAAAQLRHADQAIMQADRDDKYRCQSIDKQEGCDIGLRREDRHSSM